MDHFSNTKNIHHVYKFVIIGAILALFNFAIYTFLARVVTNSNDLLALDSLISYALAAILAYFLHSNITWKERPVTQHGIIMFFIWNGLTALIISPFFTWLFSTLTPLYTIVHQIFTNLHLPFDYDFIESTGVFCFTTAVTMVLNFIFYDRLVFGDQGHPSTKPHNISLLKSAPKISLIVPIYNTAKYLNQCLDSILNQTYQNLEIILVDDGSTDDSSNIIQSYAKKDSRIIIITQKNQGQSAARNAGLKKSTGAFLGFVDSDDRIKPNFAKHLLALYAPSTSIAVCGHEFHRVALHTSKNLYHSDLKPRTHHESHKSYLLKLLALDGRMYSCNNKLFRASIIRDYHVTFDPKLNFAEDTKFVLDYLSHASGEIAYDKSPLYIYNFGTETSTIRSSSAIWSNWQTSYQILKTWLGHHPTLRESFWLHAVHLRWRIAYLKRAPRAFLSSRRSNTRHHSATTLKHNPRPKKHH